MYRCEEYISFRQPVSSATMATSFFSRLRLLLVFPIGDIRGPESVYSIEDWVPRNLVKSFPTIIISKERVFWNGLFHLVQYIAGDWLRFLRWNTNHCHFIYSLL